MPARIVIVDDDPVHNLLLGSILEQAGYEVRKCESGLAALAEVARGCDYLITDYHMPGMNGVELIRAVRRQHSPACLVLTGSEGGAIDKPAKASGAAAVLCKPTHPRRLLKFLEGIAGGNRPSAPPASGFGRVAATEAATAS